MKLFRSLLFILIVAATHVGAQTYVGDSISAKFDRFRTDNIQEKLYGHLSQNVFLVGENMWFALYCVDGTLHKPLSLSKVAYVEVIDKSGKSVIQSKVKLENGLGNGSIFLPASIESGVYTFRCYTSWMKNFSADFFYHQTIKVINPFVKPTFDKSTKSTTPVVEFFPEGGHLVAGIKSKLAFKISDENGKGVNGTVTIVDGNNQTITQGSTTKFGLGQLIFTPTSADDSYKAVLTLESGSATTHKLPVISAEGGVMSLTAEAGRINIRFERNTDQLFELRLFAHCRNQIIRTETKRFNENQLTFSFPDDLLPDGITHFTIFDQDQHPIAERLCFKKPSLPVTIQAQLPGSNYKTRRKVSIPLTTSFKKGNLSVSITRNDSLGSQTNQDIVTSLLLTSDIKGFVEAPEYYFSPDPAAIVAADNLMLTQGWRRFSWENIFKAPAPKSFVPEYRGHIITGQVTTGTDSIASGVLTFLSSPSKIINLYASRSNERGVITFEPSEFFGQQRLIVQAEPKSAAAAKIQINSPFATTLAKLPSTPFFLDSDVEKKLVNRSVAMQVQDVYYEETGAIPTSTVIDSASFYGIADETYYLDAYTRFPVMEEVMREYVPGVLVRKRKDGFHFVVLDIVNGGVLNDDPMILLDGVPVFDADDIMAVDPRMIRKLEVVKRNYYLGPVKLNGIVSYTSYQGNLAGADVNPQSVTLNYEGLQLQREFYTPHYDTQKQIDSRMPDRRYQLYWNAEVKANPDGSALVEFYTSDVTGTFTVDIQGVDADGKFGYARKTFFVK